jgi:DNA-binding MarR family transcriptional regulator/GNAT superfamily N-acetyltransferase
MAREAMISEVRRFNRTVTAQVGALDDRFLGRDRPFGEARLLWEIGPGGCTVRALRARLELDSGYLSRLLRSLEGAGLVTVEVSEEDRRSRVVRLTAAGLAERAVYDERSDDLAWSLLEPLNDDQRSRLVSAMREVERLIAAGCVDIRAVDPAEPDAQRCIEAYFAELNRRSDNGFDPAAGVSAEPHEMRPPRGAFLLAYLHGEPVACGGLKHRSGGPSHLKRMWVADSVRGLGIGRRMLRELELRAVKDGVEVVQLETHDTLTEAIALYRAAGYVEVPPFNDEPFAHHWFEKRLTRS